MLSSSGYTLEYLPGDKKYEYFVLDENFLNNKAEINFSNNEIKDENQISYYSKQDQMDVPEIPTPVDNTENPDSPKIEKRKTPEVISNDMIAYHNKLKMDMRKLKIQPMFPPKIKKPCAIKTSKKKMENETSEQLPTSFIYIERPNSVIYRLEFMTEQPTLSTVYVHHRKDTMKENDKMVQPNVTEQLTELSHKEVDRMGILNRSFKVTNSEDGTTKSKNAQIPILSKLESNIPLLVYNDDIRALSGNPASRSKSNNDGAIYLGFEGYVLKVHCDMHTLSSLRPPSDKDIQEKLERLKMKPTAHRKNTAELWLRCEFDLLKVRFSMSGLKLTKVEPKESVEVQTESNLIWLRNYSVITGKRNFIQLPISTYNHIDTSAIIHRAHVKFMNTNAVPIWKYQMLQERLNSKRGVSNAQDEHERLFARSRGSRMLFDAFDALASMNMGMLCTEVIQGKEEYEAERQMEYLTKNAGPSRNRGISLVSRKKIDNRAKDHRISSGLPTTKEEKIIDQLSAPNTEELQEEEGVEKKN